MILVRTVVGRAATAIMAAHLPVGRSRAVRRKQVGVAAASGGRAAAR
jgi:hypothetical protein